MVGSTLTNFRTFRLEDLVRDVLSGYIRIPDFQRKFHWRWEDVNRLMVSIVRGYPIGSLLLWERPAPEDTLKIGAVEIEAPSLDEALWVIDGQQTGTDQSRKCAERFRFKRPALCDRLRSRLQKICNTR